MTDIRFRRGPPGPSPITLRFFEKLKLHTGTFMIDPDRSERSTFTWEILERRGVRLIVCRTSD